VFFADRDHDEDFTMHVDDPVSSDGDAEDQEVSVSLCRLF
jgi:hypothetical protein